VYKTLAFLLLLVFLSSNCGLAVTIDTPPAQDIHSGDVPTGATVQGVPSAKIPDSTIEMFIRNGENSRFELFFLDVKYGYDLVDFESYSAWCLEESKPIRRNAIHKVRLYNCYDPDLPPKLKSMEWNQINYVINHKNASKKVTQEVIWHFAGSNKKPLSAEAVELVEEANRNGKDYKPAEGELVGVICLPEENKQAVFLEYKVPQAPVEVASATLEPLMSMFGSSYFFPVIPFFPIPGGDNHHHHQPPPPPPPPVPEPGTLLLLACGMAGMAGILAYRKIRKHYR